MSKLFIKDRFATTPNALLYNSNISLRAKGLFAYIQGKPDKWNFSAERIALECKEGLQSVRSSIRELETFGYLQRVKYQNEKGHWEWDYILHSAPSNPADENRPTENHTTENHTTENHTTENHTTENHTNINKTDIIKKDNNTYNKYIYDYFIQIENLNEALKSFEGNKQYYFLAYKFWKLWQEENPNHQTIKKAKIESWYNDIRKMVEIDKTPIERLLAIYSYFSKHNEIYIRDFWFKTIKSVGALREANKKGEYVIDRIIDEINETIDINSDFEKYVNNLIKKHNESFRIY